MRQKGIEVWEAVQLQKRRGLRVDDGRRNESARLSFAKAGKMTKCGFFSRYNTSAVRFEIAGSFDWI